MQKKLSLVPKYNILLVHNFYKQRGGEDTVFENEKEMLINNGHSVFIYTRNNNEIKTFSFLKKIILPFTTIFSFKTYFEVKKIIKKNNIDIIHVHNTLNLVSPSIFYIARKMKIPIVQTIHNFRMLCPNGLFYRNNHICEDCPNKGLKCAIKYKCYRNSKYQSLVITLMMKIHRVTNIYKYVHFIFLTEFNKSKFMEYNKKLKIFDENKFFVKPNFIDKNFKLELLEKEKRNGYIVVGRLDYSKGIKSVVEVWEHVSNEKLTICGSGELEDELKKIIHEKKLNIEMTGNVPIDTIYSFLKKSKALIFPSLLYEGFPMVLLESFSCNTPVIAKNIGNASIIVDSKKGLRYNTNEELLDIIKNNKIEELSYKFDIIQYSKKENYRILLHLYEKLIKKKV